MARLPNKSRAPNRLCMVTVFFLICQDIVALQPENGPHEKKLELEADDVANGFLRFASGKNNSSFKVALFADLHFGENAWSDWGPDHDLSSVKVMSTVLDIDKPDFVVYLGDVVTANNFMVQNSSLYWDQAISPTRARNIPWASLFGNHDDARFEWPIDWFSSSGIPQLLCPYGGDKCAFEGTTRLELMDNEIRSNSLSYTRFDSGGGSYPGVISAIQAEWFRNKSKEMNPDSSIPEIVFWHIPSKAYEKVAKDVAAGQIECVGSMFEEGVAAQDAEMGMMKLLKQRPSVKAIFVGHNHGLDWCCPYEKMWLCYARHTGYGGYGTWARGARILEITNEPFSLKSWIRMENGTLHSEVVLST